METKSQEKPEFTCLGITDDCMLRCKMCYKWQEDIFVKKDHLYGMPSLEQYKKFFSGLKDLVGQGFIVNFGGGEALLHKDIFDLIKAASDHGFRTNLNSNGFMIDQQTAEKLGQAGLVDIKLSLDSLDPKVHDHLRGVEGVHAQVLQAISNLHDHAPDVNISLISVIYEHTYRDFIDLIEWINNNQMIDHVLIMAAMQPNNTPPEDNWQQGKYGFLWPKDTSAVEELIDRLIDLKQKGYKICNPAGQLKALKRYFKSPQQFVKQTVCNMYKAIHLSSLGQAYICFEYGILGDIKKGDDIRQMWHSEKAGQIRQQIKDCKKNCHFLINCFFEEDENI